jgi:hypothetical protein
MPLKKFAEAAGLSVLRLVLVKEGQLILVEDPQLTSSNSSSFSPKSMRSTPPFPFVRITAGRPSRASAHLWIVLWSVVVSEVLIVSSLVVSARCGDELGHSSGWLSSNRDRVRVLARESAVRFHPRSTRSAKGSPPAWHLSPLARRFQRVHCGKDLIIRHSLKP